MVKAGAAFAQRNWKFQSACFLHSGSIGFQKLKWASREAREEQLSTIAGTRSILYSCSYCGTEQNARKKIQRINVVRPIWSLCCRFIYFLRLTYSSIKVFGHREYCQQAQTKCWEGRRDGHELYKPTVRTPMGSSPGLLDLGLVELHEISGWSALAKQT